MATIFVCRHQGAIDWMKKQSIPIDYWTEDLRIENIKKNDTVIGILPMYLAAAICSKGAHFIALELAIPQKKRGVELSSSDLEEMNCSLQEYQVQKRNPK